MFDGSYSGVIQLMAHAHTTAIRWSRQSEALLVSLVRFVSDWKLADVCAGEDRVEGEFMPVFFRSGLIFQQTASCFSLLLPSLCLFYCFPPCSPVCNRAAPCALLGNRWLMPTTRKLFILFRIVRFEAVGLKPGRLPLEYRLSTRINKSWLFLFFFYFHTQVSIYFLFLVKHFIFNKS